MSTELYEQFPHIENEKIIIRKMIDSDLESLLEISSNDNVYKHCPLFLYKKSKSFLSTAINNLGGRDFEKKKYIIAGIYLPDNPEKLIGTAEMFDYDKNVNMITIGYKINESFWNQGIATNAVAAMIEYLFNQIRINRIQAFVMPDNVYSKKVLLKNGFMREGLVRQGNVWTGKGVVDLVIFSALRSDCVK